MTTTGPCIRSVNVVDLALSTRYGARHSPKSPVTLEKATASVMGSKSVWSRFVVLLGGTSEVTEDTIQVPTQSSVGLEDMTGAQNSSSDETFRARSLQINPMVRATSRQAKTK